MAGSEFQVGRQVKLMLKSRTIVEGVIFAVDPEGKRVVLEESIPGDVTGLKNVRVVSIAAVENASFGEDPLAVEPLTALSKEMALKREKLAFRAKEEALLKAGPAVDIRDAAAKAIFEALSKTYACNFSEKRELEIPALGIRIRHPYRNIDVVGSDPKAVARVADVIQKLHLPK